MHGGRVLSLAALAIVLLATAAVSEDKGIETVHPFFYSAKPISGTVVDAETKRPLDGVIIVAQWVLSGNARLHVAEVVTDVQGKYFIPGWGPKPRPPLAGPLTGYSDPMLLYFKPGYSPRFLYNAVLDNFDAVRTSDWDQKIIEMKKFDQPLDKRVRELDLVQGSLGLWGKFTTWRQHPRMVLAIVEEMKKIPQASRSHLLELDALRTNEEEIRTYLKGMKK